MILHARLLRSIKLSEKNMLQMMHFDVCFDKSWYKKLSFSYRNNDIIAARLLLGVCEVCGYVGMHP